MSIQGIQVYKVYMGIHGYTCKLSLYLKSLPSVLMIVAYKMWLSEKKNIIVAIIKDSVYTKVMNVYTTLNEMTLFVFAFDINFLVV